LNRGSNSFFTHCLKINYRNDIVFIFFKNMISSLNFQCVRRFNSKTIVDIKLKLVCRDSIRHKLSIHISHIEIRVKKFFENFEVSQFSVSKKIYMRRWRHIYLESTLHEEQEYIGLDSILWLSIGIHLPNCLVSKLLSVF
jgi:hypothetical protein